MLKFFALVLVVNNLNDVYVGSPANTFEVMLKANVGL